MSKYDHLIGKLVVLKDRDGDLIATGELVRNGWGYQIGSPLRPSVKVAADDTVSEVEVSSFTNAGESTSGTTFKIESKDAPRIYIAGPMSKYKSSGFNFRAFYDAEQRLKNDGYEVVNPARMDNEAGFDENATYSDEEIAKRLREWFPRDIAALATCGHVYLLDGWQDSRGATIEKLTADLLGLKVHYQTQPNVCTEAIRLVYGDRGQDYGHPSVEHKRMADYWSVYVNDARGLGASLTEPDVAMMLILLKIARQGHKFKLDNVIDIAGYALCAHRMADRSLP